MRLARCKGFIVPARGPLWNRTDEFPPASRHEATVRENSKGDNHVHACASLFAFELELRIRRTTLPYTNNYSMLSGKDHRGL